MNFLDYLYKTRTGRILLKLLSSRWVSKVFGVFLDSRFSSCLIKGFVAKYNIDLEDYQMENVKTFNQFFCRKIKDGRRPFDMEPSHLPSPCDGLLSVWHISADTILSVKQSNYTVTSLLRDCELAGKYNGGICLVFRLCVDNYHRYCYAVSGERSESTFIPGVLHTVRPIALKTFPVFAENCREFTIISSEIFGDVMQVEVGAMLVGKIVNDMHMGFAERGQEKGHFIYGGSTIILLLQRDKISIREDILRNSASGLETSVKMGEMIGERSSL